MDSYNFFLPRLLILLLIFFSSREAITLDTNSSLSLKPLKYAAECCCTLKEYWKRKITTIHYTVIINHHGLSINPTSHNAYNGSGVDMRPTAWYSLYNFSGVSRVSIVTHQ